MKLVHYTNRSLFTLGFVLLVVWGFLFYLTIMDEVMDETDDTLKNYREIVVGKALADSCFLTTADDILHRYLIRPITEEEAVAYREVYYDSTIYIETEDEYDPVRVMKSCFRAPDNRFYELELRISTLERDDMIEAICWYLLVLFSLLLVFMSLGSRLVLRQIFVPLQRLLHWLEQLTPGKQTPELVNETKIREFRKLNEVALAMNKRSEQAYQDQKRFIENASHELQTPLAIAQGKLELMAEEENLTEKQYQEIDEIYQTLGRAVKLNKSLLLLSRIGNGQYPDISNICLNELVKGVLDDLLDIYDWKCFVVSIEEKGKLEVRMNESLAHVLVTNLLKNAIVHTVEQGKLSVELKSDSLLIANSGDSSLDQHRIFQRFYRGDLLKKESTGLGLSIVKSIAELYGIHLSYSFIDKKHIFLLKFVNKEE